ncbi:MAG: apolipoprotein N-acyltransferase [Patescibacteria group bacterium]
MKKERFLFLLPLASGILLGSAFNIPYAWPLVFVALLPLLFFLARTRHAFAGGFCFGLIFFGSVIFWFFDTHPLDWAGVTDPRLSLLFVFIAWAVTVITLSLFTGLWATAFRALRRGKLSDILLGAALWVIFEWLRTFGFALIFYSDVTYWGAHWTFGNLGYIFAGSPLLPWASIGGMSLLSFIAVAVNIMFFLWAQKRFTISPRVFACSVGVLILFIAAHMALVRYTAQPRSASRLSVAVLSTDLPSYFTISDEERMARSDVFYELLMRIAKTEDKPDVVVFPEDTRFLSSFSPAGRAALLRNVSGGKPMVFIDSSMRIDGKRFSILSYYDENGRVLGEYKKLLLVPNGEYMPFFMGGMARILGDGAWADSFIQYHEYARGEKLSVARTPKGNFGSLFCSEIFSDVLYSTLARDGAEVLVNSSSLSFAHRSSLLALQTRAQARLRAAETGRFFLRSVNDAPSLIIAPDGTIVAESERGRGILYADIARITRQTLFTRLGNWPLIVSVMIVLYVLGRIRAASRGSRHPS